MILAGPAKSLSNIRSYGHLYLSKSEMDMSQKETVLYTMPHEALTVGPMVQTPVHVLSDIFQDIDLSVKRQLEEVLKGVETVPTFRESYYVPESTKDALWKSVLKNGKVLIDHHIKSLEVPKEYELCPEAWRKSVYLATLSWGLADETESMKETMYKGVLSDTYLSSSDTYPPNY